MEETLAVKRVTDWCRHSEAMFTEISQLRNKLRFALCSAVNIGWF
jgi:hypothetical protein